MAFTQKAPWSSKQLTSSAMRRAVVDSVAGKSCWRVEKYLGSMLYMDFGGVLQVPSIRKGIIPQGEAMLGVRDCYWTLSRQQNLIVNSEIISDENALERLSCLNRTFLCDFVLHEGATADFVFSNNVVLSLDTTNKNLTEDDIAEFVAPDGRIYAIRPNGQLFLTDFVSKARFSK